MNQIIEAPQKHNLDYLSDYLSMNSNQLMPNMPNSQNVGHVESDNTECVESIKHKADELQRLLYNRF
jgi:hypothetical protein